MLVLKRSEDQVIRIGHDIKITIVQVDKTGVKVGIDAPKNVPVHREEIYLQIFGKDAK